MQNITESWERYLESISYMRVNFFLKSRYSQKSTVPKNLSRVNTYINSQLTCDHFTCGNKYMIRLWVPIKKVRNNHTHSLYNDERQSNKILSSAQRSLNRDFSVIQWYSKNTQCILLNILALPNNSPTPHLLNSISSLTYNSIKKEWLQMHHKD